MPRRIERLDRRAHRAIHDGREDLVAQVLEVRREKWTVEQPLQFLEIHRRVLRVFNERIQCRRRTARSVAHAEDSMRRAIRRRAAAQHGVEVVMQENGARVRLPKVEIVVIAVAVADARLLVVEQRVHRQPMHPLLHIHRSLHRTLVAGFVAGRHVHARAAGTFCQRGRERDEVTPLILAAVRLLTEIDRVKLRQRQRFSRAGDELLQARPIEVRPAFREARRDPLTTVNVPARILREMRLREHPIRKLVAHVKAVRRRDTRTAGRVRVIHPHAHRTRLRAREPRLAKQRAAEQLIRRVLRIQHQRETVVPMRIVRKMNVVIRRRRRAAAVAAIPHAHVVPHLRPRPVKRQKRRIQPRVAVRLVGDFVGIKWERWRARVRVDCRQLLRVHRAHHDAVKRDRARVHLVIHLVDAVLALLQHPVEIPRRGRPRPRLHPIGCRNIKLHPSTVRRHRHLRHKRPVIRDRIPVRSIVKHRQRREPRHPIHPIVKPHACNHRPIIPHTARHTHDLTRFRHQREMRNLIDHTRQVPRSHRIPLPRRPARHRARRPILSLVGFKPRTDQLQRFPIPVRLAVPNPAPMPVVRRIPPPLRPIPVIRIRHLAHHKVRRIAKPNIIRRIRELPRPLADEIHHRRIPRRKRRPIRHQHKIPPRRNRRPLGKKQLHPAAHAPAAYVHGSRPRIQQLHKLLIPTLRHRVIHDLRKHDLPPHAANRQKKQAEQK